MLRERAADFSKGDDLRWFWFLFRRREKVKSKMMKDILTFFCSRSASRHGGYIGTGAEIAGIPVLPHGLHGIYISRYARIGTNCRIYQNVTVGEVNRKAPQIGDDCMIGAGAVLVGGIRIGDGVRIGAGAVVSKNIPEYCTAVAQPLRVIERGKEDAG